MSEISPIEFTKYVGTNYRKVLIHILLFQVFRWKRGISWDSYASHTFVTYTYSMNARTFYFVHQWLNIFLFTRAKKVHRILFIVKYFLKFIQPGSKSKRNQLERRIQKIRFASVDSNSSRLDQHGKWKKKIQMLSLGSFQKHFYIENKTKSKSGS